MAKTSIEKAITESNDKEYLAELGRFVDMDIENANKDTNKRVVMMLNTFSEKEYQKIKAKNLKYFNKLKTLVGKRLKKITSA